MTTINGTSGNDNLLGTSDADTLTGLYGDDTLFGGAGDDFLVGDFFEGGKDSTTMNVIHGDDGIDTVFYSGRRDQVFVMQQGAPTSYAISIGSTYDLVHGAEKIQLSDGLFDLTDLVRSQGIFNGTGNADTITGSPGNDTIEGLSGNDTLYGRGGSDSLSGGEGDDQLYGATGDDTLNGGIGNDRANYGSSAAAVRVNLNTGEATGEGTDTLIGIENIEGSNFNDLLTGDDLANELHGNGGSDTLVGGADNDTLDGGWGNEADRLQGGDGDDVLSAFGNDTLDGGSGTDKISFKSIYPGVDFDLPTSTYAERISPFTTYSLSLTSIEQIEGSSYDDVIKGDANNNQLFGGRGSDSLYSGAGDDVLSGSEITYVGSFEQNLLDGGEGNDTVLYPGDRKQVYVMAQSSANSYAISYGTSFDLVSNVEKIKLSDGLFDLADLARPPGDYSGSPVEDTISGSPGHDTLLGLDGYDYLYGRAGNDSLSGGKDSDHLYGGIGDDTLDGGEGSDWVSYWNSTSAITADLNTGAATGEGNDSLIDIENIEGSNFNDHLIGNALANDLRGYGGNNTLVGGEGNDTLTGGWSAEADVMQGGEGDDILSAMGADTLDGGAGSDKISFGSISPGVDFDLATSTYSERRSPITAYTLSLTSIEQIEGSYYDDVIKGDANANQLFGGRGSDTLYGGAGDDVLAGDNASYLSMAGEQNTIDGGEGNDTVVYAGNRQQFFVMAQETPNTYTVSFGETYDIVHNVENIRFNDGEYALSSLAKASGNFTGTSLADSISGSPANDTLEGLGGDDELRGQEGDDSLAGGDGDDQLYGGLGNDTLNGGAGQDWAFFGSKFSSNNTAITANLNTGEATGEGTDTLIGIENITGSYSNDLLTGDAQANHLRGEGGSDTLLGGDGNDTLDGGSDYEADHLQGGDGDDILLYKWGSDTLDGGSGQDEVSFKVYAGFEFDLSSGVFFERQTPSRTYTLNLISIEVIEGTYDNDVIRGDAQGNLIDGSGGSDTLYGGDGDDVLVAVGSLNWGPFDEVIYGGSGTDTVVVNLSKQQVNVQRNDEPNSYSIYYFESVAQVYGTEKIQFADGTFNLSELATPKGLFQGNEQDNYIRGSQGNDTIEGLGGNDRLVGDLGDDRLDGGTGFDKVDYQSSAQAITADLNTNLASGEGADTLVSIENILGSPFNDQLTGDEQPNDIWGKAGNDTLVGGGGNDTLDGGLGADHLSGGDGDDCLTASFDNDTLIGGTGRDWVWFENETVGVEFHLDSGSVSLRNEQAPSAQLSVQSIENIVGSFYHDVLFGDAQNNEIIGDYGHDTLHGGAGDDVLDGSAEDFLFGGKGTTPDGNNNVIWGDDGIDTAIYHASRQSLMVHALQEAGSYRVSRGASFDILHSVEKIQFTDGTFDVATLAAPEGVYVGSGQSEQIFGSDGNDTLEGLAGNDQLTGGAGQDSLDGGADNDTLQGGPGNDTLNGGQGTDTVSYTSSAAGIVASLTTGVATGEGNDSLVGIEHIEGSLFNDVLTGDSQANALESLAGNDSLSGEDGNDTLDGGAGTDTLRGGSGDDVLLASLNNDVLDGGAGQDRVSFDNIFTGIEFSWVTKALKSRNGYPQSNLDDANPLLTLVSIEEIEGSSYDDVLTGDEQNNILYGGKGADTLYGGAGNDSLDGSDGALSSPDSNFLYGGDGLDTAVYRNNKSQYTVNAGDEAGSYQVRQLGYGLAVDTLFSVEQITFANGTFAVTDLVTAKGLIKGTEQNDYLYGTSANDSLEGLGGDDNLQGIEGDDSLDGGSGNDSLSGGPGNDTLNGGEGTDFANYGGSAAAITANLSTGTATGEGTDRLIDIENISGSNLDDHLTGDSLANWLQGNSGNDTLLGGDGNDTLDGLWGNDEMRGGQGDDVFNTQGQDTLDGGAGQDKLLLSGLNGGIDFNLSTGVYFERQTPSNSTQLSLSSIEQIEGTSGNDVLTGDANDNQLFGGKGSDSLYGGAGDDVFDAGYFYYGKDAGSVDYIDGGTGVDTLIFNSSIRVHFGDTAGTYEIFSPSNSYMTSDPLYQLRIKLKDVEKLKISDSVFDLADLATVKGFIKGTEQNDNLYGTSGNDTLEGLGGQDTLTGQEGNDSLSGGDGNDSLWGATGDDTLLGGSGNDTLRGDRGDSVLGSDGVDNVMGGDGDDLIYAAMDADTVDGGNGTDKVSFGYIGYNGTSYSLSGVDFNLATGVIFPRSSPDTKRSLTLRNIEQFEGSFYNDVITGDVNNNELIGNTGSDTLYGGAGDDLLFGDTDTVFSYTGSLSLNPESDVMHGGDGTDTVVFAGNRNQYYVTRFDAPDSYTISAGSAVDVVYGVEKIKFKDGTFDLSAIASAQGVYKGTEQSDTITGWTGHDTIEGFGGDDVLQGGDGNDSLLGGEGNDLLKGSWGNDTFDGGAGNDTLDGSQSPVGGDANLQTGLASVVGSNAANVVLISIENIEGSRFNDLITGNELANKLNGNDGADTLAGGGGNDTLNGGAGADQLDGGSGDDLLYASLDNDTLTGGTGTDRIKIETTAYASSGFEIVLSSFTATAKAINSTSNASQWSLNSIEQIEGSSSADLIRGDGSPNALYGSGGNDSLYGGAGDDVLDGGAQNPLITGKYSATNDLLDGGSGTDTLVYSDTRQQITVRMLEAAGSFEIRYGQSIDTAIAVERITFSDGTYNIETVADPKNYFRGADGDDFISGSAGNDTIDGGLGKDTADFSSSSSAITANLASGLSTGYGTDTLINIENLTGSQSNDVLTGNGLDNQLIAGLGQDTLTGGAGQDTLDGGSGADLMQGDDGDDRLWASLDNDTLMGGAGVDTLQVATPYYGLGVEFDLTTGMARSMQPGSQAVQWQLSSIENVVGTASADKITGDSGNNQLLGGDGGFGGDSLYGGAGDDLLIGGGQYLYIGDELWGGDGNDTLSGGHGNDILNGGNGVDTAQFSGSRMNYTITRGANNTLQVQDLRAVPMDVDGTDTLAGIEQLKFSDGMVYLDRPAIDGLVYHWKTQTLLNNVIVDFLGPVATQTTNQKIQFKEPLWDVATGKFSLDVWAYSGTSVDSFNFAIKNTGALSAVFNSEALGADWVVYDNASESPKNFTVGGLVGSGLSANTSGHFKLGTVTFTLAPNSTLPVTNLEGAFLDDASVVDTSLSFATDKTGSSGQFSISPAQNGLFEMTAKRTPSDSGNAITAADALAALRIAVGLNPNPDPDGTGPLKALKISPYQVMAADVNKNGQVTSADALAILRMAVKLSSAPAQEWFFVDEKMDFWNEETLSFTMSRSQSSWTADLQAHSADLMTHNMVGVLKGDVNGSWTPPADSLNLKTDQPAYITDMARLMGVPTDQWGVIS